MFPDRLERGLSVYCRGYSHQTHHGLASTNIRVSRFLAVLPACMGKRHLSQGMSSPTLDQKGASR